MKHYNFCWATPILWVVTLTLAAVLLVKGFQSAAYGVRFPDHQMFNLLGLLVLCWFATGARELAALRIFCRHTRRVASSTFSRMAMFATRAAEAAALFIAQTFSDHRPQTEP